MWKPIKLEEENLMEIKANLSHGCECLVWVQFHKMQLAPLSHFAP